MEQFVARLKTLLEQTEPLSAIQTWVESGCPLVEETPVVEEEAEPVTEEAPVETPVVEETVPVTEEAPVETPVVEETVPVTEEAPVEETVSEEAPVVEETAPVSEENVDIAPVQTSIPVHITTIPYVPSTFKLRFGRRNRF